MVRQERNNMRHLLCPVLQFPRIEIRIQRKTEYEFKKKKKKKIRNCRSITNGCQSRQIHRHQQLTLQVGHIDQSYTLLHSSDFLALRV